MVYNVRRAGKEIGGMKEYKKTGKRKREETSRENQTEECIE